MSVAVAEGALCLCDMGEIPNPLNVITNHILRSTGLPIGTIMDSSEGANIESFGLCLIQSVEQEAPVFCEPATLVWAVGAVNTLIPLPMLTNDSMLICAFGGVISIIEPGQFTLLPAM